MIYTRITIAAERKEYECLFDENDNFRQNLFALAKLDQSQYLLTANDRNLVVFEENSDDCIDLNAPLFILGLTHGMHFIVY